jgi:hypothetical protein
MEKERRRRIPLLSAHDSGDLAELRMWALLFAVGCLFCACLDTDIVSS